MQNQLSEIFWSYIEISLVITEQLHMVIHDGHGYSQINSEDGTLEFSVTQNVVVGNSYFIKNDNHLITKG